MITVLVTYISAGYLILDNGKPTEVHHNAGCRVFTDRTRTGIGHGPYREAATPEGKRACGYCGGGGS